METIARDFARRCAERSATRTRTKVRGGHNLLAAFCACGIWLAGGCTGLKDDDSDGRQGAAAAGGVAAPGAGSGAGEGAGSGASGGSLAGSSAAQAGAAAQAGSAGNAGNAGTGAIGGDSVPGMTDGGPTPDTGTGPTSGNPCAVDNGGCDPLAQCTPSGSTRTCACPADTLDRDGDGTRCQGVLAMAFGVEHSCAIDLGGALYCWGRNQVGQLGDGTMEDRLSPVRIG